MSGRSVATRLNRNAIATPKPISVNMLRLRVLSDCHARSKKGQPPHRTTGVASASCAHCALAVSLSRAKLIPGTMSLIATTNNGRVKRAMRQNRTEMYQRSGMGPDSDPHDTGMEKGEV